MERVIRVLLVDDHAVVRRGIARIVDDEPDMEVVGEFGDGAKAVDSVPSLTPDVVIMDIGMPGISGIDATRQILERDPSMRVLMLTVYDHEDFLYRALQAGASGYVLKGAEMDELLTAIRTVDSGEVFVYPRMTTKLVRDYVNRLEGGTDDSRRDNLTPREREVLPLLADALTNRQIAERLLISPYTVQTHRQNIMQKLDLHNRSQILRYAVRKGLISLE